MTVYARFQQGFRPGGLAVDDQHIQRFRNDRASTLELGFRRGVPGVDPVALTGNLAYTRWRDIQADVTDRLDRKSTRLNSQSLMRISYAVFCLKNTTDLLYNTVTR